MIKLELSIGKRKRHRRSPLDGGHSHAGSGEAGDNNHDQEKDGRDTQHFGDAATTRASMQLSDGFWMQPHPPA